MVKKGHILRSHRLDRRERSGNGAALSRHLTTQLRSPRSQHGDWMLLKLLDVPDKTQLTFVPRERYCCLL